MRRQGAGEEGKELAALGWEVIPEVVLKEVN